MSAQRRWRDAPKGGTHYWPSLTAIYATRAQTTGRQHARDRKWTTGQHHASAVAQPRTGNHGRVARCAFAKDILKAILAEAGQPRRARRLRNNDDDITLQADTEEPTECAGQMSEALGALKGAVTKDTMVLSNGKRQVLGLTRRVCTGVLPEREVSNASTPSDRQSPQMGQTRGWPPK